MPGPDPARPDPARDAVRSGPSPIRADARDALVVEGLSKSYETHHAVSNLSFRVREGEILGLVGPNGAGKTTTLRSIVGVLPLRTGRVVVRGHDLVESEVEAKRSLAWIPDDPEPFEVLTVREHMRFTAALYGISDWEQRADELLAAFELTEKREALGGELSRGMRQKLAFCRAWLHRPGVVLMDEPLSGLDPRGIRHAKDAIQDLASSGTAVILSSHQLDLIEEMAHRILILDHGRNVFTGTLAEARRQLSLGEGRSLEEIFLEVTENTRGPGRQSS